MSAFSIEESFPKISHKKSFFSAMLLDHNSKERPVFTLALYLYYLLFLIHQRTFNWKNMPKRTKDTKLSLKAKNSAKSKKASEIVGFHCSSKIFYCIC